MRITDRLQTDVTVVSNTFIDEYMAAANGEYVKVYLYVLRHRGEALTPGLIADAENLTDADVCRALTYWEKAGALKIDPSSPPDDEAAPPKPEKHTEDKDSSKEDYDPARLEDLQEDEDFTQLLYIAQKYMNKIFSPREAEVFAYLYDGLGMNEELLEYLVEYCVQGGHTSIRYIETVARNWKEKGFVTPEEARAFAESFQKNTFGVMKAFGISGRSPGEQEKKYIDRWFKELGFSRELVTEACDRTMNAIHEPSFQYADKILSDWYEAGVHSIEDVAAIDEKRQKRPSRSHRSKDKENSFHNYDERDTDYDSLMVDQVRSRMRK